MARLRTGVGLAALAAACLIGSLAALAGIVSVATGWERVVLVSGSMSPALIPGDLVFTESVDHPVELGTVVLFQDPASDDMLTHRVVEILPDDSYRTQGDANVSPDSTPVPPADVIGRGRLLVPWVGLPAAWLQTGRTVPALALLAGLGLVLAGCRWAWPPTSTAPDVARRRRWRATRAGVATTVVGIGILILGLGVPGVLAPTGAAFTAAQTNTGNSMSVASPLRLFLKTSGGGDVPSSATLPLSTTAPTAPTLPNYDVGRNPDAGLTISKGGMLTTPDATKMQRWNWTVPVGGATFASSTRVRLWSAMKGFDTVKAGSVQIRAYDCNTPQSNCRALGSIATVTSSGSWSGGSTGWVSKDWNLGNLGTLAAGRVLQLRVVVHSGSADDMMFAYDTTAYPADLTAG